MRYDWLREIRGYTDDQIDATAYNAAVTLCGQTLDARASGQTALPAPYAGYSPTFTRYTINGRITSEEDPEEVESQMDLAWAGEVIEEGGMLYFEPGSDKAATATITEDQFDLDAPLVTTPHRQLNQRDNAAQARIDQSRDHSLKPLDLPLYRDAAAIARDGETRVATISLRFVNSPVAATWLQRVNLLRRRESDVKSFTVLPGDDFALVTLRPANRVTLTIPSHGVSAKRYELEGVTYNPGDATLSIEAREDLDGTYGVTLGIDGVYRVPLGTPPLLPREFEFGNSRSRPRDGGLGRRVPRRDASGRGDRSRIT